MPSLPLAPRNVTLVGQLLGAVVPHTSKLVMRWSAPPSDSKSQSASGVEDNKRYKNKSTRAGGSSMDAASEPI